ncbi:MAG: HAMP domain-containing histidine kinase [Bernardetiaceae bacterium]|nr:HAMP domain-containing histidine kinase [Bernardetiaceae bacterium]
MLTLGRNAALAADICNVNFKWLPWPPPGLSKQQLRYIVILMSLALVGLLVMQFYWLNNAVKLSQERFRQEVMSVLDNVQKKLDARETMHLYEQMNSSYISLGSSGLAVVDKSEKADPDTQAGLANRLKNDGEHLHGRLDPYSRISDSAEYLAHHQQYKAMVEMKKMKAAYRLLEHFSNASRPVHERMDHAHIDSLISFELRMHRINMPYYYAVVLANPLDYQLILTRDQNVAAQTALFKDVNTGSNNYSVRLFPDDELTPATFLYIYFPNKNAFILKELLAILVSAILFIALIVFSFATTVFTIIRQKKVSEVTRDFINNMTHEFKTPISTISLATEMLQDADLRANDQLFTRYLNVIRDENQRLGSQVEKVLQIATLEKGDFKLKIQPVNVHELIGKLAQNMALQVENRGGRINLDFQATQPQIEADEVHLTNIVLNLLDNANKYSPDTPKIHVGTEDHPRGIVITIADQGQGISKDTITKIFDKFYRVPTGNLHDVKGFGLGLSYVKTMVDAHYGTISVSSELHKGTTFTILLPHKHKNEGS